MANENINNEEIISDKELDSVSGGNRAQCRVDIGFFQQLGNDMYDLKIGEAWSKYGVNYTYSEGGNSYEFSEGNGEIKNNPQWAAMGHVLSKINYPGFNGNSSDKNYVCQFLKDNFHINYHSDFD